MRSNFDSKNWGFITDITFVLSSVLYLNIGIVVAEPAPIIISGTKSCFGLILNKYKKQLKVVAEALLEYETLTGDEIKLLCQGKKINLSKKLNKTTNSKSTPKAKSPNKKRAGIPLSAPNNSVVTNDKSND